MTNKNLLSKSIKFLIPAVFCFVLSITHAYSQSTVTGGISGNVTDSQNAVVSNASITVTNIGTNKEATVTTDSDGGYRVSNLQPGTYTVSTTVSGFAPFKRENIIVEVGRLTPVDIALGLANATATVEVTSEAPVINTNDNTNANNFNQTSINELPINGRRWSNFAILSPSAVPDGTFGLISFRGISGLLNNNTIDGGDNNQAFFSEERGRTRINYVISQSAIREFQVNTSNYSAEYGRSAGGVTNAVTKSGTNQFHGDLFYYNRNSGNGARNPRSFIPVVVNGVSTTAAIKPQDLRQQFGGTIGGPIIKDRLFFFFSYDQQKRNFPGVATFSTDYLNPTVNGANALNNALLLSRGLSQGQIDSSINFIRSLTGITPRTGDQTLYLPKLDWQINSNNTLSATYNRLRWASPAGIQTQAVNNLGRASFGDDFVKVDSLNLRLQSTISSNILNEARYQYGRDFEYEFSQAPLPGEPLTESTILGPRPPNVTLSNALSFGVPTFLERPKYPDERRNQFADTLTWTSGRHTFKFGGDVNHVKDIFVNLRFQAGSYTYSNINDFIIDYTHFLSPGTAISDCATSPTNTGRDTGRCYTSSYSEGRGAPGATFSTIDYNFFGQDDFRVTPRLTVNLGLRWEYEKMPKPFLANVVGASGNISTTGNIIIPQDGRTIADATSTLPSDKNNFGPRIGLAYDVFGDGKTSFRAGYGIYYGRIQNSTISNALINTGNSQGQFQLSPALTVGAGAAAVVNPCTPIFPNPSPCATNDLLVGAAIQFFSKNFQQPLINQYDVVIEHQIAKNTVVSASYIGSLGRNLPTFVDQNFQATGGQTTTWSIIGGPYAGQTFTFPFYSRVIGSTAMTQIQSTVSSEYNAVVFQINRRFTDGLQFQGSYTLAKATDTNQNSATFTSTNSPLDLFNRSFDAGTSTLDVRHKVVVNGVYAPNFYKGSKASFYNYVLNGWSISPIYVFYSGRAFDAFVGSLNNTGGDGRLPLAPRNAYRLPALWNVDLRLSKRFRFSESMALEFLAEGFNIFNRTQVFQETNQLYFNSRNAANNTGTLTFNPAFGAVTTTDSTLYRERQIQLSARFQF